MGSGLSASHTFVAATGSIRGIALTPTGSTRGDDTAQILAPMIAANASPGSTTVGDISSGIGSSYRFPEISEATGGDGAGGIAGPSRSLEGGTFEGSDESMNGDRTRQRQISRARVEEALETAQKEGEYSHLMRSGTGGGFDATSKTVKLSDAVGDAGGGKVLFDMAEVRDALCSLAVARGELLALAAASPD